MCRKLKINYLVSEKPAIVGDKIEARYKAINPSECVDKKIEFNQLDEIKNIDRRQKLLNEFYASLDKTNVKIEWRNDDFHNLKISNREFELDYGEYKNGVLKYKLNEVSPEYFQYLLTQHLHENISLCGYFHNQKNCLFALNLDSSRKGTNDVKVAALLFIKELTKFKIIPLVIKSGHGYHFWVRLSCPIKNKILQEFMKNLKNIVLSEMIKKGSSPRNVNCTTYPRLNVLDISLRLFGGRHSKTGEFSSLVTAIGIEDTILDMDDSWNTFEWYINHCMVSIEDFEKARENVRNYL